jgi:hypothetical protein
VVEVTYTEFGRGRCGARELIVVWLHVMSSHAAFDTSFRPKGRAPAIVLLVWAVAISLGFGLPTPTRAGNLGFLKNAPVANFSGNDRDLMMKNANEVLDREMTTILFARLRPEPEWAVSRIIRCSCL